MTGIYFSGTGNSRYCLGRFLDSIQLQRRIAVLEDIPVYSIEETGAAEAISRDSEIILAYPVYYSSIPKILGDFIEKNSSSWSGKRVYIIATMGLFSGDGAGVAARRLQRHGAVITGGLHLKMPDCIGDVKALKRSAEMNRQIIENASVKADRAGRLYAAGTPTREGLGIFSLLAGLLGQRLYFRHMTKDYKSLPKIDREKCVGCGLCAEKCPMKNLEIKEGKAIPGDRCTLCYRCFAHCPAKAITVLGDKVYVQYKKN